MARATSDNDSDNRTESDTQESREQAEEENGLWWKGYRMSGFIYNVFIGVIFVVAFAGFLFCLSRGNYQAGFYWLVASLISGAIGIIALYQYYVVNPHKTESLKFSVAAETIFRVANRTDQPSARFWVVFPNGNETAMVPITDCLYVRFTNDTSKPIMIDYYAVDIRNPSGAWSKTVSLDRKIGQLAITDQTAPGTARDISLDEPTFDRVVKDVSIISGGTVK